jgi:rod shape-determining protein MreD
VSTSTIIKIIGAIALYLFLQVFIVGNLVFFDVAFCFLYISVIIFLPNNVPVLGLLSIAFFVGLVVDIFYNTAGIHASACVLIAYLRSYILKVLFPTRGLETEVIISLEGMGTERFIRYIIILTFTHHLYLFFLEAGSLQFFLNTSLKVVASVVFTSVIVFLLHIFFKSLQNS